MISLCVKCYSTATEARWGVNKQPPDLWAGLFGLVHRERRKQSGWHQRGALPPQTLHRWRCLLTDKPDRCNAGVTASNFHAWLFFFHRRQLFRGSPPAETDRYELLFCPSLWSESRCGTAVIKWCSASWIFHNDRSRLQADGVTLIWRMLRFDRGVGRSYIKGLLVWVLITPGALITLCTHALMYPNTDFTTAHTQTGTQTLWQAADAHWMGALDA